MRPTCHAVCVGWLLCGALLVAPGAARGAEEDVFSFIPAGGKTILTKVLATKPPAAEVQSLVTGKRTREEWSKHLREHAKAIPVLQGLQERELLTLADYLSFNMPLPAARVPANPAQADWAKVLPPDGRDLALDRCQSCHIITVVVTQDRSKEAWLGTMNKPSHIEVKLTPAQREALASYLILNAAIPIDQVPEELRAGGATY